MPNVIILCGIPGAGKSTYSESWKEGGYKILSRDVLRLLLFRCETYADYTFSKENESHVTNQYNYLRDYYIKCDNDIILDNTHCRESYLDKEIEYFTAAGYFISIKFFDIPLWKAWWRCFVRGVKENEKLPLKVLRDMKRNYDKINQKKYAYYTRYID